MVTALLGDYTPALQHELLAWFDTLSPTQQYELMAEAVTSKTPPSDWKDWLTTIYPETFRSEFSQGQSEYWEHIRSIQSGVKPQAFFLILGRGGGKSSSAEAGPVLLGAEGKRKFCLYVRGTQTKADESIQNIATLLESSRLEVYYPDIGQRSLGRYGNVKGWSMSRLRCENGFSVVGLGLDAAVRGVKLDEDRPDLIIVDDVDDITDGTNVITKKINILTKSILPAGSADCAVLWVQNLIHKNSILSQLLDGRQNFLLNRIVSGPWPAVEGLKWDYILDPETNLRKFFITAGEPTWSGQPLSLCEEQMNEWGIESFLTEGQHEVQDEPGGIFSEVNFNEIRVDWDEVPELLDISIWIDPAVTSTDNSDSMGIQADGVGVDNLIYRLYSWEGIMSPGDAIEKAIRLSMELGCNMVGVETDQGGDLWELAYTSVMEKLRLQGIFHGRMEPSFSSAKAGAGHGSKAHRALQMKVDYDLGRFRHVRGTHEVLEAALFRFPKKKPYDLVDACYWSWYDLKYNHDLVF